MQLGKHTRRLATGKDLRERPAEIKTGESGSRETLRRGKEKNDDQEIKRKGVHAE